MKKKLAAQVSLVPHTSKFISFQKKSETQPSQARFDEGSLVLVSLTHPSWRMGYSHYKNPQLYCRKDLHEEQ